MLRTTTWAAGNRRLRFSVHVFTPSATASTPVSGGEEHIVITDHQYNRVRLDPRNSSIIDPPKYILDFVITDPYFYRLELFIVLSFAKCVIQASLSDPYIQRDSPLLCDAVTDEQHIARSCVGLNILHQLRVGINPTGSSPKAGGRSNAILLALRFGCVLC